MKPILLIVLSVALLSCKSEKKMVYTVGLESDALETIANTMFRKHFTGTEYDIDEIKGDVTKKEMRLLKKRLSCEEIYLIYEKDSLNPVDSIVIFTRGGVWEKEHTIVVDMRKKQRANLPDGFVKFSGRVYYRSVKAIIPIS